MSPLELAEAEMRRIKTRLAVKDGYACPAPDCGLYYRHQHDEVWWPPEGQPYPVRPPIEGVAMAHNGYLPASAQFLLDQACIVIGWAFDSTPYLVGSSLERADYRDVDVRVILDDEVYARMFPGPGHQSTQPYWSLLSSAISAQLAHTTGLPIDFQIQQMTAANKAYSGIRVPLGIFPTVAWPEAGTDD